MCFFHILFSSQYLKAGGLGEDRKGESGGWNLVDFPWGILTLSVTAERRAILGTLEKGKAK